MTERPPDMHPYWLPRVNHDYDVVLRQWRHPPPPWIWADLAADPVVKIDTIMGVVGVIILAICGSVMLFWHPWL